MTRQVRSNLCDCVRRGDHLLILEHIKGGLQLAYREQVHAFKLDTASVGQCCEAAAEPEDAALEDSHLDFHKAPTPPVLNATDTHTGILSRGTYFVNNLLAQ